MFDGRSEAKAPEPESNGIVVDVLSGLGNSISARVDGFKQISGATIDLSYMDSQNIGEKVGSSIGEAGIFIGTSLLAKRIPFVGKLGGGALASIATGGVLGLTAPLQESQSGNTRIYNGVLGAGTMGILEYVPGLAGRLPGIASLGANTFGGSLARINVANGLAGVINTEANSFINTGSGASLRDVAIGTGTWMAMGSTFHAVGKAAQTWQQQKAAARLWESDRPWQHKEVRFINAADLRPNEKLAPGHYNINYESQGYKRTFDLYISNGAIKQDNAPVVAFLHGLSLKGKGRSIIREVEFNRLADETGAIVAYPQAKVVEHGLLRGRVQSWNDQNFGYLKHDPSYSDVVAFQDMMGVISRHAPYADTGNIAVSGFSLGGKLAHRLAAKLDNVSGLSTIHSTIDHFDKGIIKSSASRHPIDVQVIHGTGDSVLPFNGGKSRFTLFLENAGLSRPRQQAEFWAASNRHFSNRIAAPAQRAETGKQSFHFDEAENYYSRSFRSANGHNVAELVEKNGPHRVNGAKAVYDIVQLATGLPLPPTYFDARQKAWDFLIDSIKRQSSAQKSVVSGY